MEERKCKRCGIDRELPTKRKGSSELCKSCRVPVEHTIRYGEEVCMAWRGDFDKHDRPVHNGQLFRPGDRNCGHADCINPEHIIERGQE